MSFETISVVGLGYIGLPTAAMFASRKIKVIGVDVNLDTVETINRGEIHIVEPELDMIVHATVMEGYLKAVVEPEPADAFLIAVPTPFMQCEEGQTPQPDLRYIESACKSIAPVLKKGDLVVLESTSPVGTTQQISEWLAEARPDLLIPRGENDEADINISHCPERVLPGHVVRELVENDRVIGGITSKCCERSIELYKIFVKGDCISTNARTAEMAKLTENSCRDVQIAFANELSIICDKLDINVWELISLANRHPRINILKPGPGVGGHCIAVDPWFIVSSAPESAKLIKTAREVNDLKPDWVIEKLKIAIAEFLLRNPSKTSSDITIACYGLAFKPNIDDLRESPALKISKSISEIHIGKLLVVEPNISELESNSLNLVDAEQAHEEEDIRVILVAHDQFKNMKAKNTTITIDTVGITL
ncbi:UDP-N-acetyl-D-mannosamine dehydrogenase [Vibrio breoganii]|uniref:UDP-N-acetyl-D-mannosamine dehydrogenase n=1 Tax=Vibrio breoganii TaxID=553239 RepID=UPI000313125F|nr:UDP-N-acetyl-D-mannosamine dehydrogenase [Vibrio breoganii]OED98594.1 UDP-N-acetyl-D-mannosaminuronic acid dehydrogenase [Vibrio breoganii ZF-55]